MQVKHAKGSYTEDAMYMMETTGLWFDIDISALAEEEQKLGRQNGLDHVQETKAKVVWLHWKVIWLNGKDGSLTGYCKNKKREQMERLSKSDSIRNNG